MSFRKLFGWSRMGVVSFLRGTLAAGVFGALIWPAHAAPSPIAHWAFQAVTDPKLPVVTNSAWCRTALDRFILQKLETDGIRPVPEATRNALIRRVSFDLTGLPPSAESTELFSTRSLRAFSRSPTRIASIRRTLGAALVGCGPLC